MFKLSVPVFLLLTGGLLTISLPSSLGKESDSLVYYVTPTQPPNPTCPSGKPCHTLNYYAENADSLLSGKDDVSLLFLSGLYEQRGMSVSNTTNLTVAGWNNMVTVYSSEKEQYTFLSIQRVFDIKIENLSIIAGQIDVTLAHHLKLNNFLLTNSSFLLTSIHRVFIHNSTFNRISFQFTSNNIFPPQSPNSRTIFNDPLNSHFTVEEGGKERSLLPMSQYGTELSRSEDLLDRSTGTETVREMMHFSKCHLIDAIVYILNVTHYSFQDSHIRDNTYIFISFATYNKLTPPENSIIHNVTFQGSTLRQIGPANLTIDGCLFKNGASNAYSMTPIEIWCTDILFVGETTFENNTGIRGGALYLIYSTIFLDYGANVSFINNKANDVGGAIFIYAGGAYNPGLGASLLDTNSSCFKLTYNIAHNKSLQSSLRFVKNSAPNGGLNIYGTSLKTNFPITPDGQTLSYQIQNKLFNFDIRSVSSLSPVSSEPKRVCLCENGRPKCGNYSYIVQERYYTSGEEFSLSVVLVGDDFGTLTGGVYASLNSSHHSTVGQRQHIQQVESNKCSELKFSVYSKEPFEILILIASTTLNFQATEKQTNSSYEEYLKSSTEDYQQCGVINKDLSYAPIFLNITILDCPLGFTHSNSDLPTCQCKEILLNNGAYNCTVTGGRGLVYRNGTTWVSASNHNKTGVIGHRYCPYDYCKTDSMAVDLTNPDKQCALEHTGILCGGCPENLSLALGSSKCLLCDNDDHIALLLVFVAAGIALVFFIKVLDFTVAKGTINGLILYANIIWINQSVFFPNGGLTTNQTQLQLLQVSKVFIAWLNLDFGIETCFLQGLDGYWKTWLQFVFPIYIWVIAGVIIVVCRYSPRATRLFGNNSVQVLATLFLMSYVKLLRTIVTAFGFAILDYPDGAKIVWLYNGNVLYFGLRHAFLFVAASFSLLVLWLPYTTTLLLVPCLKKFTNYYFLRWINKWKPFYDAYYGPLKDKHHYWIGLTLVVRVVLAVVAVAIQAIAPTINVLLILLVSVVLYGMVNHVYKNNYVAILNTSFLLNLILLSGGFLYIDTKNDSNTLFQSNRFALVLSSVAISFFTFLGIVLFHAYSGIKTHCCKQRADNRNIPTVRQVTRSVVSIHQMVDEYREPLLESETDS